MRKWNWASVRLVVWAVLVFGAFLTAPSYSAGWTTSGVIYVPSGGSNPGIYRINPDGSGYARVLDFHEYNDPNTGWATWGDVHSSYQLHAGKRWFAVGAYSYFYDPTGLAWVNAVIFKSDAGDSLLYRLDPDIDNVSVVGSTRWIPGDGYVSLTSKSSSTGKVGMFAMPITWDANGNPTMGAAQLAIQTASYTYYGMVLSVVGKFDWNTAGTAIAFIPLRDYIGNPLADGLYTETVGGVVSRIMTTTPGGFAWGSTGRISFAPSDGSAIKTMKSDGTNVVTLLTVKTSTGVNVWAPGYSPAADTIVFQWLDSKRYVGLKTIPSAGGTAFNLTTNGASCIGWR